MAPNGPLGRGLVYDRNLSKQELRRGDYPWRVIRDFCNERNRDISVQGGAISQKNSRPVIILHEAADFSGLDQQIS